MGRPRRIPTTDDYAAFDGAHCRSIWEALSEEWRCPGCERSKREVMRWTKRRPDKTAPAFMGWLAAFHEHHDHGSDRFGFDQNGHFYVDPPGPARFAPTIVCDNCNVADGAAKRRLRLPKSWTFSPDEIRSFVKATPHDGHEIDYEKASAIYEAELFGTGQ